MHVCLLYTYILSYILYYSRWARVFLFQHNIHFQFCLNKKSVAFPRILEGKSYTICNKLWNILFPEKRHQQKNPLSLSLSVCIYIQRSIVIIINNNRILLCLFSHCILHQEYESRERIKEHFKNKSSFAVFFSCLHTNFLSGMHAEHNGKKHIQLSFFSSPLSNIIVCLTHLCLQSPLTFPYMSCIFCIFGCFFPMS